VSDNVTAFPGGAPSCGWTGCGRASHACISGRFLCLEHFFEFSYRRMNSIRAILDTSDPNRALMSEAQTFLSDVVSQTTRLATEIKRLDPALRDHLLALSTSAADLYNRVRRAPRLPRRIPCLLRTGILSPEIAERCSTLNISQRGACLELDSTRRPASEVLIERVDTKISARARVAWFKDTPSSPGKCLVGIEILDNDDFWGLGLPSSVSGSC